MPIFGRRITGSGATEKTTLTGAETFPISGTQHVKISTVEDYVGKRLRVRAATTANITIATALNNGDSLDGVTLATDEYVLVKNQSAPAENGIYKVGVTPARAPQYDAYNDHPGALITIQEGTANADTIWLCTSNTGGTLETTAITFVATTTSPVFTTPQINDTSADHQYIFAVSELAADRTVTLPLLAGNDTFVFADFIQTLTNKTLTAPTIADFTNAAHDHGDADDGGALATTLINSGAYTPTRSAEANLDSNVTMTEAQYLRVLNTVTVSGRFTADPTAGGAASFEIDLPIASNLGAAEDLAGVAFSGAIAGQGAEIIGVAANNTAKFQWIAVDVTSQSWSYSFTYQVI